MTRSMQLSQSALNSYLVPTTPPCLNLSPIPMFPQTGMDLADTTLPSLSINLIIRFPPKATARLVHLAHTLMPLLCPTFLNRCLVFPCANGPSQALTSSMFHRDMYLIPPHLSTLQISNFTAPRATLMQALMLRMRVQHSHPLLTRT